MNELSFLDSLFNNVLGDATPQAVYTCSAPRVDVKEEDNAYTLEMELPGRSEKDVNIELDHDNLTISSKQEETKEEKKEEKKWQDSRKARRPSRHENISLKSAELQVLKDASDYQMM